MKRVIKIFTYLFLVVLFVMLFNNSIASFSNLLNFNGNIKTYSPPGMTREFMSRTTLFTKQEVENIYTHDVLKILGL